MNGQRLLCDFHIHTHFSDGSLGLNEVVNLYGNKAFDAISITDHILDQHSFELSMRNEEDPKVIGKQGFNDYLHTLWSEARRAWEEFGMLLIPGVEITNNTQGYHILAVDIKEYIEPSLPVEEIVRQVGKQGGIAIAPHPHRGALDGTQQLMYLWNNHDKFTPLFDAWEVANRDDLFNVVGLKKFNYIANSDFHEERHLYSWKTVIGCDKNVEAIKYAIRKNDSVSIYLFRDGKSL
jgi:predicted metal-dependent phosphoesterase TrpH